MIFNNNSELAIYNINYKRLVYMIGPLNLF